MGTDRPADRGGLPRGRDECLHVGDGPAGVERDRARGLIDLHEILEDAVRHAGRPRRLRLQAPGHAPKPGRPAGQRANDRVS
jgi:hypothetical protein